MWRGYYWFSRHQCDWVSGALIGLLGGVIIALLWLDTHPAHTPTPLVVIQLQTYTDSDNCVVFGSFGKDKTRQYSSLTIFSQPRVVTSSFTFESLLLESKTYKLVSLTVTCINLSGVISHCPYKLYRNNRQIKAQPCMFTKYVLLKVIWHKSVTNNIYRH